MCVQRDPGELLQEDRIQSTDQFVRFYELFFQLKKKKDQEKINAEQESFESGH